MPNKHAIASRVAITLLMLLPPVCSLTAQDSLPVFLHGDWKVDNKNTFEHWDVVNSSCMKGFLYELKDGYPAVSEYLDIMVQGDSIAYTATVLNQNNGRGIAFMLTRIDSVTYAFENQDHDFPKMIIYQKQSPTSVFVKVSDGSQKIFSYYMIKQEDTK